MLFYINDKKINLFFLLILIIKSLIIFYIFKINPNFFIEDDTVRYLYPGLNIFSEGFFGVTDEKGKKIFEIISLPVYPFFLGFIHYLFDSLFLLSLSQNILVAYSSYLFSINIFNKNNRSNFIYILLFNTDILIFYYSFTFMTEGLVLIFTNLFLIFLIKKNFNYSNSSILMIFSIFFTFLKPTYIFFTYLVAAIIFIFKKRNFYLILFFIFINLFLIDKWKDRNYLVSGISDITSQKIDVFYSWSVVPFLQNNNLNYLIIDKASNSEDKKFVILYTIQNYPIKFAKHSIKKFISIFLNRSEFKIFPLLKDDFIYSFKDIHKLVLSEGYIDLKIIYYLLYLISHVLMLILFIFASNIYFNSNPALFLALFCLIIYITVIPSITTDPSARFRIPIMPYIYFFISHLFTKDSKTN